jgi:hypothetical protein
MWESFFGFKKTPFSDSPDAKQLFASQPDFRTWGRLNALSALESDRAIERSSPQTRLNR